MSDIATITSVNGSELRNLCDEPLLKRKWFGKRVSQFKEFFGRHGHKAVTYDWNGYFLVILLSYLEEKCRINLMNSEFDTTSKLLAEKTKTSYFFLTQDHKKTCLDKLKSRQFSETEFRDYYNEFNEADMPDAGRAMLDGVGVIVQALEAVNENSVTIIMIG